MYLQSHTLLLVDVFENFRKMFLEIYELDPAHFPSAPELVWQAALKKTKVKLDFLIIEKGIREEKCQFLYRYAKASNKYKKDYDKNN